MLKFNIYKVQTLNFRYLKFDRNCSYIGGGYERTMQIVAIDFNVTVIFLIIILVRISLFGSLF